ncbi:immunoglobulin domain-containing protein [Geothrix sp. PMB-07]|uniref:immunoglobulin domain-containing protein n=1 Tax=Geothrix sp. PMB-07 TaxID=3068640 RepID=UPI002740C70B|nr:immunoglobulin domain-containing protein [Geothrix sp. PMB-07]WLT31364.1 immunoglobulin domain-containing protein [Geothrix sp. PMB-07]
MLARRFVYTLVCLGMLGSFVLGAPISSASATAIPQMEETRGPDSFGPQDRHQPAHLTILTQPASQTALLGQRVTFKVVATGRPSWLSYQWRKNGHRVGWDSPTLTIHEVHAHSAGTYTVTVSNITGHVVSAPAVLTVNLPPQIQAQPQGQTVVLGAPASLSVTASGSGTLSYQWRKGGVALTGATLANLNLPAVTATDAGLYDVVVTNTLNGTITSTSSKSTLLQVNLPPVISTQPASLNLVQGSAATFSVKASVQPGGSLGYQWRKGGAPLAGATGSSYAIASVQASDAGSYDVLVTNTLNGTLTATQSAPAALGVNVPPVITLQPQSQTVDQGTPVSFSVAATSDVGGVLSYQWRKDLAAIPGATQATFGLASAAGADAGTYDVVVTSTLNGTTVSSTSLAALLKVNTPPTILVQPQTQTVLPPDPVTFTVSAKANNGGILSYVWKKDGAILNGATSASYTVASTEFATNADAYSVTVSEGNLSTESVTVNAVASVSSPTYAGDPVPVPSRPLTVLPSFHVNAVNFPNGAFRLGYDESLKNPVWTAYVNFPVHLPYANSTADYKADPRLAAPQVGKDDYTGIYTGGASYPDSYDRGHQVPRADVSYRYTPVAGDDATIMSNLVPQISQFNQQTWQKLEDAIGGTQGGDTDGLTSFKGRIWVYTGSVFPSAPTWWHSRVTPGLNIAIPVACYKIVVHETTPGHPEVLAMLMPNTWGLANSTATLTGFVTSVAHLESITGLDFFPNLATVAPGLDIPTWKATVDARGWRPPFEQAVGPNVHMIQPSYDTTIDLGTELSFAGAATPNSSADAATTIASTTWTFGDATPSSTGLNTTHLYTSTGTFSASFSASDSLGSSNSITRVIRVIPPASSNAAPTTTPALLPDQTTTTGQAATVSFIVADDRTLARDLQVSAASDNAILLPATGIQVTNASGAVTLVLTPAAGQTGSTTVTVRITDGDGSTATRTFLFKVDPAATNTLTEGFESGTKTGYATGNVTFPSGVWTLNDALVGTSATDRKTGLQSLRVRNGILTMAFDYPKGAQTVSVNHAKFGTDANSTWELWYSTNSGGTWTLAGPPVVSSSIDLTPAVFTLNVQGPIRFEFRKTAGGTTRFNLDDFQIQGY